jgi:hypothetical protein
MSTVSRLCVKCKLEKPLSAFYARYGYRTPDHPPTEPGHVCSECKDCMRERGKKTKRIHPTVPRAKTEALAIEYLAQHGIHALPGKAVHAADVDVVAWGGIWLEVKYAQLTSSMGVPHFKFTITPKQMRSGFRGHLVLLICEYTPEQRTYHIFRPDHPVFYIKGRIKAGFTFRPNAMVALKHGNNRVVMTQPLMDEAEDRIDLIWDTLRQLSEQLKQGGKADSRRDAG